MMRVDNVLLHFDDVVDSKTKDPSAMIAHHSPALSKGRGLQ